MARSATTGPGGFFLAGNQIPISSALNRSRTFANSLPFRDTHVPQSALFEPVC